MSDRSFRDRLAHIADVVDLDQLDGLTDGQSDQGASTPQRDEPNLARLMMDLEDVADGVAANVTISDDQQEQQPINPNGPRQIDILLGLGLAGDLATYAPHPPLIRAITQGKFRRAEELILDANDPEYFNDGSIIHALTTGKSPFVRPRNLKIVRLMLERGANPNQGLLDEDNMEFFTETPLEMTILFYLALLKAFRTENRTKYWDYSDSDLLNTIGINGEEKLDSETLISHTRKLIDTFLENGADVNLQTTNASRTIFHELLVAEVTDPELVDRMITLGAHVNLTDVHGTTPFMDLIRFTDRAVQVYSDITTQGKRLLLDAQNCSGESALWRAMFNRRLDCSDVLLLEGARSHTMARVQEATSKQISDRWNRRNGYIRRKPIITNLPAFLSPLLFDSPCVYRERLCSKGKIVSVPRFSAKTFNKVVLHSIAPVVDSGWFCTSEVDRLVHDLIKMHTDYRHLTEEKVFQEIAMIPLMFGNLSGGLRQQCLRNLLETVLFKKDQAGEVVKMLKNLTRPEIGIRPPCKRAQSKTDKPSKPSNATSTEWHDIEVNNTGDSACVVSSVVSDTTVTETHDLSLARVTLSEPEMSRQSSTPNQLRTRHFQPTQRTRRLTVPNGEQPDLGSVGGVSRRIGDNWVLRENPQYQDQHHHQQQRAFHSLEEIGAELEISHDASSAAPNLSTTSMTVSRIQRMLQETDDMLERLQSEVNEVATPAAPAPDSAPANQDAAAAVVVPQRHQLQPQPNVRVSVNYHNYTPMVPVRRDSPMPSMSNSSTSSSSSSSSGSSNFVGSDDSDEDWSFETELRFVRRLRSKNFSSLTGNHKKRLHRSSSEDDTILRLLTPMVTKALAKKLGLPPGMLPCLELEVARLQLGAAIYRHATIKCDGDCEGDDDESQLTSDGSSWNDESLSEPSLSDAESSGTNMDLESSVEYREKEASETSSVYEPTVPAQPRILSSSSSSSEEGELDFRLDLEDVAKADEDKQSPVKVDDDWFSVVGEEEHTSTTRYVQEKVGHDFDHSTESDTDKSEDEEQRLPGKK